MKGFEHKLNHFGALLYEYGKERFPFWCDIIWKHIENKSKNLTSGPSLYALGSLPFSIYKAMLRFLKNTKERKEGGKVDRKKKIRKEI